MNAVGRPISRVDGPLKVTGGARYTADIALDSIAHAAIVYSTIANGRTVSIDTTAAEKAPGVLAVLTHGNMPRMRTMPWSHLHPQGQTYLPLQDDRIHYAGQPVALVVAATLDQATHAGTLVKVAYEAQPPSVFDCRTAKEVAVEPAQRMWPLASSVGDADKAIAEAPVKIERTYTMPDRHHNPMEPHATLAVWDDAGMLTLYDSTQMVVGTRKLAALVLGLPEEQINVVCEFLGGGFGGKSWSWPHTLLAALAAKVVSRPVRLQLTRAQMYSMVGHQAATVQRIALGAGRDGKLTGIRHDSVNPTSMFDDYVEYAALASRHLWGASGGISTSHRVVRVNRNTPVVLRAPMEAQGHFALECAMDELAYAAGLDPVELRLRNDTDTDPYSGRPFSARALSECLTKGAMRFGWDKRSPEPRSMRDGRTLIGQGMAAAIFTHWRWPAKARVTLKSDGSALVEAAAHDIGTGAYTVMAQVAAYDAGRIINPKTARSQAIGGIIWGVGQALLEQSETDPASGQFMNRNFSGYLAPTNADIPELDVSFVGGFDREASPLGAKGLGELTAVSVAPAIANAVYHATAKRVRDLPITLEKLL